MLFYPLNLSNAISSFLPVLVQDEFSLGLCPSNHRGLSGLLGLQLYIGGKTAATKTKEVTNQKTHLAVKVFLELNWTLSCDTKKNGFSCVFLLENMQNSWDSRSQQNFLWFKKILVTPQMFWIARTSRRLSNLGERKKVPKLRYPTMRMPNSSKCQRWSSQWRGWSPAMFKKIRGWCSFFLFLEKWRL